MNQYYETHARPASKPDAQSAWLDRFMPVGLADWSPQPVAESEREMLVRHQREAADIEARLSRAEARRLLSERIWAERDEACRQRVEICRQRLIAATWPGLAMLEADLARCLDEAERLQQAWDLAIQQQDQARVALHLASPQARAWLEKLALDAERCALQVAVAMQELQACQIRIESEIAHLRARPLPETEPAVYAARLACDAARERHQDFCGEQGHYTRKRRQAQQALSQLAQAREVMRARQARELLQLAAGRYSGYEPGFEIPSPAYRTGER